jgi:hypothetical protein
MAAAGPSLIIHNQFKFMQNIHQLPPASYAANFQINQRVFSDTFSINGMAPIEQSTATWQASPDIQRLYNSFEHFAQNNMARRLIDFDNGDELQAVFDSRYAKYIAFYKGEDVESFKDFLVGEVDFFTKWIATSFTSLYPAIRGVKFDLLKYIAFVEAKVHKDEQAAPLPSAKPQKLSKANVGRLIYILVHECNFKNCHDAGKTCEEACIKLGIGYSDWIRQNYKEVDQHEKHHLENLHEALQSLQILDNKTLDLFNKYAHSKLNLIR